MEHRKPFPGGLGWHLRAGVLRILAAGLAVIAWGCASLPPLEGRPESRAVTGTANTRIGTAVAPTVAAHPGKTGVHLLPLGTDAFAARMALAAAAQRSIDAQYYIWHGDQTGVLLFEALVEAARRGVRVRILLDDQTSKDNEDIVTALGGEPNIEVRYYNPFPHRRARMLNLGDFARLNRRMHNKAFVVDNQAAVVGGRNIGNEYFGAGTEVPFMDLDVLAVGAVVPEVSAQFDLYWNSASAYPAKGLVGEATPEARTKLAERFAATRADPHARAYLESTRDTPLLAALMRRDLSLEWVNARIVADDPAKTLDRTERTDVLLLSKLIDGSVRSTFDLVSPYFVPGDKGSAHLEKLARSGVQIRVLTNSYMATDVSMVHSGYAKRRERLAAAGVRLFELKGTGERPERDERGGSRSGSGSSPSSLHAKTFAADGERTFVGSFNFDPRSALLNTEMGMVIESAAIAGRLSAAFGTWIPERAYEVRMRPDGALEWIERSPSGEVRHASEPGVGAARRAWLGFLSLLPIDWLL